MFLITSEVWTANGLCLGREKHSTNISMLLPRIGYDEDIVCIVKGPVPLADR